VPDEERRTASTVGVATAAHSTRIDDHEDILRTLRTFIVARDEGI
jgi:hypothetical protein